MAWTELALKLSAELSGVHELLTAYENDTREKNEMFKNVSEFADYLAKRHEAIIANVRQSLARIESDALANALRTANDVCRSFQQARRVTRLTVSKAIESGSSNLDEAARKLERTSRMIRDWRVDSRKERRLVENLVQVEHGRLKLSTDSLPNYDSVITTFPYFEKYSTDVYSISMIANEAVIKTKLFKGGPYTTVNAVCLVEEFGVLFVLLQVGKPLSDDEYADSKFDHYEIQVIDCATMQQVGRVNPLRLQIESPRTCETFTLFSSGIGHLFLVCDADSRLMELSVSCSRRHSSTETDVVKEVSCEVVKISKLSRSDETLEGRLTGFEWNGGCAHAVALYEQRAVILNVRLQRRALVRNRYANYDFRGCAVSAHGICILLLESPFMHVVCEVELIDLNGARLASVLDGTDAKHKWMETLLNTNVNVKMKLFDKPDEAEVLLVFEVSELMYVRVRSRRRGFARRRRALSLPNYDGKKLDSESLEQACGRLPQGSSVDTQLLIEGDGQITDDDGDRYRAVARSASAYFLLDRRNNAVKRYTKANDGDESQTPLVYVGTLYTLDGFSHPEDRLTGMCVLDEQTLLVVRANCHLDNVLLRTERSVHTVRFTTFRIYLRDNPSHVHATEPNRLLVAVEGDSSVFEIKCERGCANWRLTKVHMLPHRWQVRHTHFDARSSRFGLVLYCVDSRLYRVLLLNERLVESVSLPLPICTEVDFIIPEKNKCLVALRDTEGYKQLVYDVLRGTLLFAFCNTNTFCSYFKYSTLISIENDVLFDVIACYADGIMRIKFRV